MNSGQLLRSSSFKITLAVCMGHAMLIGWMMTAIANHQPESPTILYGHLVERESNTIQKTVISPIHAKQDPINQASTPTIESSQGIITSQQPDSRHSNVSSAPISLPSAADPRFNNPKPPYPIASRENGEEGRVWLSLCVSEDGAISRLQLAQSSGHPALDRSALNTVTHWKFHPARQNGAAIPYCYRLPIIFVLT
ncbi:energy transducer TonB [Polynucleobacter sp. HIN6]|uniref:energy transducer TonB n=1 Tax=Polynucleobacter sp. HIN6 TaxID=3047865 RepID=UPI002572D87A|nr:energy transducer TonB [Polynucleobacter sp. HIN6]